MNSTALKQFYLFKRFHTSLHIHLVSFLNFFLTTACCATEYWTSLQCRQYEWKLFKNTMARWTKKKNYIILTQTNIKWFIQNNPHSRDDSMKRFINTFFSESAHTSLRKQRFHYVTIFFFLPFSSSLLNTARTSTEESTQNQSGEKFFSSWHTKNFRFAATPKWV